MIVLEGADNSGKTTFASRFSGLPVYTAGPAPKDADAELACIIEQMNNASKRCVQDRLTCISQQVYGNRLFDKSLGQVLVDMIKMPRVIVVYCRPPDRVLMDFSTHNVKSYDTEEHLKKLLDSQHTYIERYDALMSTIPHVLYDWTDPDVHLDGFVKRLILSQKGEDQWLEFRSTLQTPTSF
jgi:hypothetical protein